MRWPPYLLKLRIKNHRHDIGLWLPLFLIGPIVLVFLLAVFLVLLPFALLAMIFTWQVGWWRPVFIGIPAVFRLLWSSRGLAVDVEGADGHVEVIFR
jgi:hypothetical protein